ncbi:hypothetical protein COHA_010436 [Chlorella ohadii]|uniref:Uncharacterized protein n=1 Tax=Chlorella ohadii TaxID=2649997 RepID=A0AAD5DCW4_9CHLO|nr:hypothetical protein COHA_010436 [Chlorella ohadii]
MALDGYVSALAADCEAGCCTTDARLVAALLRRDKRTLDTALASHTASQLAAVQQPLPLYHAAALADWPEAVTALAAAGVPPSAADALVHVKPGSQLACMLVHASIYQSEQASKRYNDAARSSHYTALGMAAALGHVQASSSRVVVALLAVGASATAGREQGALPACLAAAVYGRSGAVQRLLSLLAAAGGHMTASEVADSVQNVQLSSPIIPALLRQLTEQCASLHDLDFEAVHALVEAAIHWGFSQIVELLPATFAASYLPSAASQQDPAFLLRLLRHAGCPLPCPASVQVQALELAISAKQPLSVAALLAAGVQPTAANVTQAICTGQPGVLRALLAVARPPEPPGRATIDLRSPDCARRLPSFVHQALHLAAKGSLLGTRVSRLQVLEALLAAGYSLPKYPKILVHSATGLHYYKLFNPLTAGLRMQPAKLSATDKRVLRLTVPRVPWSPSNHHLFPPAFRRACRTLLLAAHRSSSATSLGSLPADVLPIIMQQATYPLSQWVAVDCLPPAAPAVPCPPPAAQGPVEVSRPARGQASLATAPAVIEAAPGVAAAPLHTLRKPAKSTGMALRRAPRKPVQPAGMAADVADAVAAFSTALGGGAPDDGGSSTSACAVDLAASSSFGSKAQAAPTAEQLCHGLAALSFSTHTGPFTFGASG